MKLLARISLAAVALLASTIAAEAAAPPPAIIPAPETIVFSPGTFRISPASRILLRTVDNKELAFVGQTLAGMLNSPSGWKLEVVSDPQAPAARGDIELSLQNTPAGLGDEGYRLEVTPERIAIRAHRPAGAFYAVQTLRQLLPPAVESPQIPALPVKAWSVPCVRIEDKPRYAWRGMLLDVSRHFFPKDFIYKYLDFLAQNKLNVFQMHLTDDQGWRIEIKRYPRLTEVGAWRADRGGQPWSRRTPQGKDEKATYGGYFTQEEIRRIVEYAHQRFITVVPEIEMPGHSRAVLAAYPEFLCSREALPVATGGNAPQNALCAGRDGTYEFLNQMLDEVIDLFPSPFIHIGGDECNKSGWRACPDCQGRMRKEGLKTEVELQSYFVRRIEKHINSRGRRLIGWDEILEGGLAPNATVMSWRGMKGGIEAAQAGHDVVMSPTTFVYFDYCQGQRALEPLAIGGYLPVTKVYQFEPTPAKLTPEQARHILGGQANLWAEFIPNPSHAEYMIFPRIFALSEVLWSPAARKDWPDFARRMEAQFERLDLRGIHYARSYYDVVIASKPDKAAGMALVTLQSEAQGKEIRYTTNGSEPTADSARYAEPLRLQGPVTIKAATFEMEKRLGRVSEGKLGPTVK